MLKPDGLLAAELFVRELLNRELLKRELLKRELLDRELFVRELLEELAENSRTNFSLRVTSDLVGFRPYVN